MYLGWRMVSSSPTHGFNVYRSEGSGGPYSKVNVAPVTLSTNYVDTTVTNGVHYCYVFRLVDGNDIEGPDSNEACRTASDTSPRTYLHIQDIVGGGTGFDTRYGIVKAGDFDGDAMMDFLIVSREIVSSTQNGNMHVLTYRNHWTDLGNGPIDWSGDGIMDVGGIIDGNTHQYIVNQGTGYKFNMDVVGDFREETIELDSGANGALNLWVYTNTTVLDTKAPSPWENRQHAQKQRWSGH